MGDSEGVRLTLLLDTNFLLMMARGVIAPSSISEAVGVSYRLATSSAVVNELRRMAGGGDSLARLAAFALSLLERLNVSVLESSKADADSSLIELAMKLRAEGEPVAVATSDRELRRRLRERGVATLYYREEGSILEVEWEPL